MTNALQNNKRDKRLIQDQRLQEANDIAFSRSVRNFLIIVAVAVLATVVVIGEFG